MEEETAMSDLQRADAVQRDNEEHSVLMPPKGHPQYSVLPPAHLPRPMYWPVVLAFGVVFLAWGIVTTLAVWLPKSNGCGRGYRTWIARLHWSSLKSARERFAKPLPYG